MSKYLYWLGVITTGALFSIAIDWRPFYDGLKIRPGMAGIALVSLIITLYFYFLHSRSKNGSSENPLAEVDVLVAYGRTEEAIKLLEDAIAQSNSDKAKQKLIELRGNNNFKT